MAQNEGKKEDVACVHSVEVYMGGVEVLQHQFLNWELDWTECSDSHSAQFMSGERLHDAHPT